jgi:tetratricopeptide (TPR) repeat protein
MPNKTNTGTSCGNRDNKGSVKQRNETGIDGSPENIEVSQYYSEHGHDINIKNSIEKGDYLRALEGLKNMESYSHEPAFIYTLESQCLISLGRYIEARERASVAMDIMPDYIPALGSFAIASVNLAEFDDAFSAYMTALSIEPHDPESHAFLAELHLKMQNPENAMKEAKLALSEQKNNIRANNVIVSIEKSRGNYNSYIDSIVAAYRNTGMEEYIIALIDFLLSADRDWEALKIAKTFSRLDPSSTRFGDKLAHIYLAEGKFSRADHVYKTLIELNDNYESAMLYMSFLAETQMYGDLLNGIDRYIGKYGDREGLLYLKYYALSETGKNRNAVEIIKQLYSRNPHSPVYATAYAVELAIVGDYSNAISIIENIGEASMINDVFSAMFTVYLLAGRKDDALQSAMNAMASDSGNDFLISFPWDVIRGFLSKGLNKYAGKFVEWLLQNSEGEMLDIATIYSAGMHAITENYAIASRILDGIDGRKRYELAMMVKNLQGGEIKDFLEWYMKRHTR